VKLPEVIVVGAGIVGCTIAYELAKAGARVQVIEPRAPGQGATRASAGILAPYIEGHGSSLLRDLGKRSLDLYDDFIAAVRTDSGHAVTYQRNGTFELAFSPADADRLTALGEALRREGIEAQWVRPNEFSNHEPLASSIAGGALLIPTHGFVAVTALTLAAVAAAQRGGTVFTSRPGRFVSSRGQSAVVGVQTASAMWSRPRGAGRGSWSSRVHIGGGCGRASNRFAAAHSTAGQARRDRARDLGTRRILCRGPTARCWSGSTVEDVGFDEATHRAAVKSLRCSGGVAGAEPGDGRDERRANRPSPEGT
jgi:glycine oxidase